MGDKFKFATKLYDLLNEIPKTYISPVFKSTEYDINQNPIEIEDAPYGQFVFMPSKSKLAKSFEKFKLEFRDHRYRKGFDLHKINSRHIELFTPLLGKYKEISIYRKLEPLHKHIVVYYDIEPHLESPEMTDWYQKLPNEVLKEITDYCRFHKAIVSAVLEQAKNTLPKTNADSIITEEEIQQIPAPNPTDERIYVEAPIEEVREFFSFLTQQTNQGRIMSEEDLDFFLNLNFAGFPKNTENRTISFAIIAAVDFRFIIYRFYKKFKNKYRRQKWAEMLHLSFPNQFGGNVKYTASNFKENDITISKLTNLGLPHPF